MPEGYEDLQASGGVQEHTPESFTSTLDRYREASKGNIRAIGLIDEVGAFARTINNAKKATGQ